MSTGRFDYVRYDEISQAKSAALKEAFEGLDGAYSILLAHLADVEELVGELLEGRSAAFAKEKVMHLAVMRTQEAKIRANFEEAYMWCGKAIRDDQVANRGAALQEERNAG